MQSEYIQNSTILAIDDNPTNLNVIADYLDGVGGKVLLKKDGESGILLAIRKRPDIILLDIMMPGIDGYETCRRLKSDPATQSIPVIFTSALNETVDKVKAFESGGVDFIGKPFQVEEILARVETHLKLTRIQKRLEQKNLLLKEEITKHRLTEEALGKVNEKLQKLATLDGLTQVANRRRFEEYFYQEWQRAFREKRPISIIMCDIDDFKPYNDAYGHQAGDECLQQVSQAMSAAAMRPGDLVTRYGGEEFTLILPNTKIDGANDVAQEIKRKLQAQQIPHCQSSVDDCVTLSMGIASIVPTNEYPPNKLIEFADQALYHAKTSGKNRIKVHPTT